MLPHLSVPNTLRQKQEDSQFKTNMGYTERLYLKTEPPPHTHTHYTHKNMKVGKMGWNHGGGKEVGRWGIGKKWQKRRTEKGVVERRWKSPRDCRESSLNNVSEAPEPIHLYCYLSDAGALSTASHPHEVAPFLSCCSHVRLQGRLYLGSAQSFWGAHGELQVM